MRTLANDAKANESLRLIKRGSGQAFEDAWVVAAESGRGPAPRATRSAAWDRYAALHGEIVELDASGDWNGAVEAATTRSDDGASAALDVVDRSAQADVDQAAEATTDTLRSGRVVRAGAGDRDPAARPGRGGAVCLGHQPATQGVRMRTPSAPVAAAAVVLLAGCGGYDDTAVPEPDAAAEPSLPEPAEPQSLR